MIIIYILYVIAVLAIYFFFEKRDDQESLKVEIEKLKYAAKHGNFLFDKAKSFGWNPDDGEGAYEFICRTHYAQGLEDGKKTGKAIAVNAISHYPDAYNYLYEKFKKDIEE